MVDGPQAIANATRLRINSELLGRVLSLGLLVTLIGPIVALASCEKPVADALNRGFVTRYQETP